MTTSLWTSIESPRYPRLEQRDLDVDIAVVGGGITGVTAALLLKLAGRRVALFEARSVGSGVTSGTTGHLTEAVDTRYREIERDFGADAATLVAASSRAAIEQIAALDDRFQAGSHFRRVPGYFYSERSEERDVIEQELESMRRAGLSVARSEVPLPLPVAAGLRIDNQAEFHPLAYVLRLAQAIPGGGSHVFEATRVLSVDDGEPCRLHFAAAPSVRAKYVILATHGPLNQVLLQTKVAQYRSYVVSGPMPNAPDGLFWDTDDPYHYVRSFRGGGTPDVIVGGADHKTGKDGESDALERLGEYAARLGLARPLFRWSAQVVEPVDGLPFIGKNAGSEHVFVATGFSGNGLTFGTLAAMILRDACLGSFSPYAELYDPRRLKSFTKLGSFLGENVDFPLHLLSDAVRPPDARSLDEVPRAGGRILRIHGRRVAVYRSPEGRLHGVSPVCTHLGCLVAFNATERSWDCPCHGSRFDVDGNVLDGPASKTLERIELEE